MSARIRLAELVAALAVATDFGLGLPLEHVQRQALIAMRLAGRLGLADEEQARLYYVALLAWVGCWVDAYEQAKWWTDDHAIKAAVYDNGRNPSGLALMRFGFGHVGQGRPALERMRIRVAFVARGRRDLDGIAAKHCGAARDLALRIGVDAGVAGDLLQTWERWDGRGTPAGLAGEEISIVVRLVALADVAAYEELEHGVEAAIAQTQAFAGTLLDPELVERYGACAHELLADVGEGGSADAVLAAEPALGAPLTDEALDAALEAIAAFADVKSPFTIGHSQATAGLAAAAARTLGLPQADVVLVRRAGLIQDLGRLGVSNAIWDKPGPLDRSELERVRLHPYFTERMLVGGGGLAQLGALAAYHHERMDGSGYPHGLSGEAIPAAGRVLAAADVYCALCEPRPHRPAHSAGEAAAELGREVRAGRLDGDATAVVLRATGQRVGRRHPRAAGLTTREVEVLRLLAHGLSNRQIAERLVVSRRTVASHAEHIYAKTGTANRAMASLYAAQHGLLGED